MRTLLKKISPKEAETKLRAGEKLVSCVIAEPLVLAGKYDHPVSIEKCEIHEIKAEGCVFSRKVQFHGTRIYSTANFNRARFKQFVDWVNVDITKRVSFEEAIFESSTEFTDAHFLDEAVFYKALFKGDCDMDEMDFQHTEFHLAQFKGKANFSYSQFGEMADFSRARFDHEANFEHARFSRGADFDGATFMGKAVFEDAVFVWNSFFNEAKFHNTADFDKSEFHQHADFRRAVFKGPIEFRGAIVKSGAHFNYTEMEATCEFDNSTFNLFNCVHSTISGKFNFPEVTVNQSADFEETVFATDTVFIKSKIGGKANFSGTRFEHSSFSRLNFYGLVNFDNATFSEKADFKETHFVGPIQLLANFTNGADIKWHQIEDRLKNCLDENHIKARDEYGKLKNVFRKNNDYYSMDRAYEMFRHHENMADEKRSNARQQLSKFFVKDCTGYGTKPLNVFLTSLGVIVLFAFIYSFFGQQIKPTPSGWDSYLYFSLTTFIAAGVEGIHPDFEGWMKILVVFEAFAGFLLMTFFIVMLARKLIR